MTAEEHLRERLARAEEEDWPGALAAAPPDRPHRETARATLERLRAPKA